MAVSNNVMICGYFVKPQGVSKQYSLGKHCFKSEL